MRLKKSNPILTACCTVLVALSLTLAVAPATAQTSKEKIRLLSAALRAHDAGDLQAAKTNLEALIRIAPDDPNVQKLLKAVNEDLARQGAAPVAAPSSSVTPGAPIAAPSAPSAPAAPGPTTRLPSPSAPAAPAPATGGNAQDKMALMSDAIRARDSGDLQTAKQKLEQLNAQYPGDPNVQRMLDEVNRRLTISGQDGGTGRTTFNRPGGAPAAPAASAAPAGNASQLLQQEYQRQRGNIRQAMKDLNKARDAAADGKYHEALEMIGAIEDALPFSTATMDALEEIEKEKVMIAVAAAKESRSEADRQRADAFLQEYRDMFGETPRYKYLATEVADVTENPWYRKPNEVSPEWALTQDKIADLMVTARSQYLFGDYQGAQKTLKEIETRDPDNVEAKALQVHIAEELDKRGIQDYNKTRAQMLEEVNRSWQRPQVFDIQVRDDGDKYEIDPVIKKLQTIEIPRVSFNGMPLSRVVETLSELSVRHDNTTDIEGDKGVNIILIDQTDIDPPVTLTLRNFTLDRILEFISQSVSFQYDVKNGAVVVQRGGGDGSLETEFFPISRATVIRMTGVREDSGGGDSASPFAPAGGGGGGNAKQDEEEEIKSFFERAGVSFAGTPGANLAYDGTQIIVTQTPRNLERLARIMRRYDETKQVEIEAKFMEIQQGVLEELGFNWQVRQHTDLVDGSTNFFQTLPGNGDTASTGTASVLRNLTSQGISSSSRQGVIDRSAGADRDLTNLPPSFPGIINLGTGAAQVAGWTSIFGDWEADIAINALEQHTGTDLMTAPRVTVLAGKPASIVVAQQFIYPTEYGDVEAEISTSDTGGSAIGITPGTPQNFETESIGVTLEVTPNVENDNSITLKLNPRVSQFEGFVEYGGSAIGIAEDTVVEVPSGFFMPIFSVREVNTEVTIFDGATVVLGGLTRDEIITIDDKVPVLGDVPLLGRLFKNKGETRQKRNLLIFVSANLISPGGSPANQSYRNLEANSLFQNPVIVSPGGAISRTANETPAK